MDSRKIIWRYKIRSKSQKGLQKKFLPEISAKSTSLNVPNYNETGKQTKSKSFSHFVENSIVHEAANEEKKLCGRSNIRDLIPTIFKIELKNTSKKL